MPLWEVVREIENECARNQMRDVFFDEIETDNPLEAVRAMLKEDNNAQLSMEIIDSENVTVFANCSGIIQRFLFTKI